MSIDRRKTHSFFFICADDLKTYYRRRIDAYCNIAEEDHGRRCDVEGCGSKADFEYFPGLVRNLKAIKRSDLISSDEFRRKL